MVLTSMGSEAPTQGGVDGAAALAVHPRRQWGRGRQRWPLMPRSSAGPGKVH